MVYIIGVSQDMIIQFQLSAENIPVLYALDDRGCLWMNRSIDRADSWVKLPLPSELISKPINVESAVDKNQRVGITSNSIVK